MLRRKVESPFAFLDEIEERRRSVVEKQLAKDAAYAEKCQRQAIKIASAVLQSAAEGELTTIAPGNLPFSRGGMYPRVVYELAAERLGKFGLEIQVKQNPTAIYPVAGLVPVCVPYHLDKIEITSIAGYKNEQYAYNDLDTTLIYP